METVLFVVLLIVLLVRWAILSDRLRQLERSVEAVAGLTRRVWLVEQQIDLLARHRTAREAPVEAPAAPVERPQAPVPTAFPQPEPMPAPPVSAPAPPPPRPMPPPAGTTPAPPPRNSAEWEALVGGSWFNKLGILVLVIAIALFLGFSFTQFGPAGRSAIGLAGSLALLASGAVLERRAPYVVFARGLMAGGWAGLYFTTYAMQAVAAAQVIHSPLLGAVLLLAAAAAMVFHSLRYRVPMVTGLAYAAAFGALALTPLTSFSALALVPLAGSLVAVAYRFEWPGMALFGLAATYLICGSRGDSGAPLALAQSVFAAYWAIFEVYDLRRARRRSAHPAERAFLPLNALGFGLLSYAKWSAASPDRLYLLAAGAALAYLASTLLRARVRPPASFAADTGTLERILAGGFEGPVTLAAACSAAAAVLKLHGQTANTVLLIEGELLFLAALFFRQRYPRALAAALFGALGVKFLSTDLPSAGVIPIAGHLFQDWTPAAILAAVLCYANLALRRTGKAYGYAASALVALIAGFEVGVAFLGDAWLGIAAVLFYLGWRWRRLDLRLQGYAVAALALGTIAWHQSTGPLAWAAGAAYAAALCAVFSAPHRFGEGEREKLQFLASLAASAAAVALAGKIPLDLLWGPAWMALALVLAELGRRGWPAEFAWHAPFVGLLGAGRVWLFTVFPLAATVPGRDQAAVSSAALLAYVFAARSFDRDRRMFHVAAAIGWLFVLVELRALLDAPLVAPAWALAALAPALLARGRTELRDLRWHAHALAAIAFGRALTMEWSAPHVYASAAAIAVLCALRFLAPGGRLFHSLLATTLAAALLYREVSGSMLTVAWGTEGAVLLAAGFLLRDRDLRLEAMALFLICTAKLFFYDLRALETWYRILSFFVLGVILVAVSWLYTRFRPMGQGSRLLTEPPKTE